MEGAPKIEKTNNILEKENSHLEKIKQALKPLFAYGMYALISLYGGESNAQNSKLESRNTITNTTAVENNRTLFDQSYVVPGENGFNYYSPDIVKDYETFYTYAVRDQGFKESQEYLDVKDKHSSQTKSLLESRVYISSLNPEEPNAEENLKELQKELNDFEIIEDENVLFDMAMQLKYENVLSHIKDIEKQKQWLIDITSSEAYLQRLIIEFGGNKQKAEQIQQKRIKRLEQHNYFISNADGLSMNGVLGHVPTEGKYKHEAFLHNESTASLNWVKYHDNGEEFLEKNSNITALHEFEHQANSKYISDYAKEIFYNEFDTTEMFDYQVDNLDYYTDPTELLARKRVFDYELEKMEIKKYDEEFTEDHYNEIKDLQGEGVFDANSEQFFKSFRKDGIMLIMNTVAENINNSDTIHWNNAVKLNNEGIA